MRSQLSKMKKSIGYTSESAIDERIASIELWLRTETMSLKEEKDYMKEIAELKKARPKVGQVGAMENALASRDTGANLKENIGAINEEMALYRDGKRQVSQALAALNESRKEQLGDLPKYIEERDEIGKKIKAEMMKRNALRDEFRSKTQIYCPSRSSCFGGRLDQCQHLVPQISGPPLSTAGPVMSNMVSAKTKRMAVKNVPLSRLATVEARREQVPSTSQHATLRVQVPTSVLHAPRLRFLAEHQRTLHFQSSVGEHIVSLDVEVNKTVADVASMLSTGPCSNSVSLRLADGGLSIPNASFFESDMTVDRLPALVSVWQWL